MLVRVIPVSSRCLAHAVPSLFRYLEAVWESPDVILGEPGRHVMHFFLVLLPKLFVGWQRRMSRCRRLAPPRSGVVIVDQKLLLQRLPRRGPVVPQQRLVTMRAIREYLVEDWLYRLLGYGWFAVNAWRR